MAVINGVDVSSYQTGWKPASGDDFVFVKASEGTTYKNPYHTAQVDAGRTAGLVVGHYHWLHHGNIAEQAKFFVSAANPQAGDILVCDWEQSGCTNADKNSFIAAVKKLCPKNKVILYCNLSWWEGSDKKCGDGFWPAYYGSKFPSTFNDHWDFWQYTQTGTSNVGAIDKNKSRFTSKAELKAWATELDTSPGPVIAPSVLSVDGVALSPYETKGTKIKWRSLYHNNNVQANSTCYCVTQAIAVAEARLKKLGVIKECLDFWQFGYGQAATASADTHAAGGVVDVVQIDDVTLKVLREVGFTAAWYRGPGAAYGNFSTKHIHAVLSGCPHVSDGAGKQITSVRAGHNGLVNNAADYGPKVAYITWQDAWKKYVDTITVKTASVKDDDKVSNPFHYEYNTPQEFHKANTYQALYKSPAGVTIANGPGYVTGEINLTISGLRDNDTVYVRTVAFDYSKDGKSIKRQGTGVISEIRGFVPGWQWGPSIPFRHDVLAPSKGYATRRLRFEVSSTNPDAVIQRVDIAGEVR